MSPRQSGGRYTPGQATSQQAINPNFPAAIADTPPPFYGRRKWTGGGLPGSGSATPERTLAFSTTILDSIIPFVYGERKVTGLCAGRDDAVGQIKPFAFIFAFGEQDSITDLKINGETASGLAWISNITYRYGTGSETIPTGYTQFGTNADWAKYAYVTFKMDILAADVPGSLDVTAVLGGQHVYDYRDTTTDVDSNLALIAYDIQTNDYWKGLAAARIDTDQWTPFTDWCEEAMGDATARFEFNGIIYQRDPEAAVAEVLGHGFASMYFGADGKLKIWSEMDPEAITGDWSVAGTSVTEDASGGAATTELEVGDIVYIRGGPYTVVTIPDDDTFTIDSSLTASAQKVRPTSGVYIRKENLVQAPIGHNIAPGSIPDIVIVNHTQSSDWGSHQFPAPGDVTGDKREEITANGCTNESQAARMSATSKNIRSLQPFEWELVADGIAAGLEPGDIFFFDDDVLTMQAARVLPPLVWLTNGHIKIKCREYNPSSMSTTTETDATPPSVDAGWTTYDTTISKSATYTIESTDEFTACDASGGAFTVTLPTAVGMGGRIFRIKKTDSSGNAVTIDGDGTETIDGSLTQTLTSQYESVTIMSDDANWWIV